MKENVGRADRVIRVILGPALLLVSLRQSRRSGAPWTALAGIIAGSSILESAITKVCPLNRLLGIDTRSEAERRLDTKNIAAQAPQPMLPQV